MERASHGIIIVAVSKYLDTKISDKHVLLDGRTKMKVNYAREVLSEETASAMERSDFPFTLDETEQTRAYIRMCDKPFKTMNTTTLDGAYMKDLIAVLHWFQTWFHEINREAQQRQGNKSSCTVWQRFIPRSIGDDQRDHWYNRAHQHKLPLHQCGSKKYVSG